VAGRDGTPAGWRCGSALRPTWRWEVPGSAIWTRRAGDGELNRGDGAVTSMRDKLEASVKVFISSVISGMEQFRAAAREAAESLRYAVIVAEDFGASPSSPQQVCLAGVRDSDVVILLLGARYGAPQPSGLSPTHEEYREARGTKPVLAFVQTNITPEPGEEAFLEEVSGWEDGGYRQPFDTPASLRAAVTRALHEWELGKQAGPVNEEELSARAAGLLPHGSTYAPGSPLLHVTVAGAPAQQVLRPSDLDGPALHEAMEREALYGQRPVLDRRQGVQESVAGITLAVRQANAEITLDEQGGVRVSRPGRDAGGRGHPGGIPSIIEEDVSDRVADAIHYAGWLLEYIDPTHRLSRVAIACRLDGVGYMPWRTRAEAVASPDRASTSLSGRESADSTPVVLPRAALLLDDAKQAEDITVRLRRQARR
jgi:Domain of unknown function (DUF4062)